MSKFISMTFKDFIKSKQFVFSFIGAVVILGVLGFLSLQFLSVYTHHGKAIKVPSLGKLRVEQAIQKLDELDLELIVIDTVDFDKNFPPLSIVSQDPITNSSVKGGRKIYVKINAAGYSSLRLPEDLMDKTYRYAERRLQSLGLEIGKIRYEPHLAKDVVIQIEQGGRILRKGDKITKGSVIDIVLGDGSLGFKQQNDSLKGAYQDVAPSLDSIF